MKGFRLFLSSPTTKQEIEGDYMGKTKTFFLGGGGDGGPLKITARLSIKIINVKELDKERLLI